MKSFHTELPILIQQFLSSKDIRNSSRLTYENCLKLFLQWLLNNSISDPTKGDILEYKRYLEKKNLSSFTISSYLVAIRQFFEWAEKSNIMANVTNDIKLPRHSNGFRRDPLTANQAKQLLASITKETIKGKRDYALTNLLIRTGLRTIEIQRANVGDIQEEENQAILWIRGKGRYNKDEFVLLTESALRPIKELLQERENISSSSPLFSSFSKRNYDGRLSTRTIMGIVKQYLRKIGIDNRRISAHSLRHTAITLSLKAGASVQEAQILARHKNINTTLIYAHNIDRFNNPPESKIDDALSS